MELLERLISLMRRHWWAPIVAYVSMLPTYLGLRELQASIAIAPMTEIIPVPHLSYAVILRMTCLASHLTILFVVLLRLTRRNHLLTDVGIREEWGKLSRNQRNILMHLTRHGVAWIHGRVIFDSVDNADGTMSWPELSYRLETLRLLQLVEKRGRGFGINNQYRLTDVYWSNDRILAGLNPTSAE